jgi:hypothetical protein
MNQAGRKLRREDVRSYLIDNDPSLPVVRGRKNHRNARAHGLTDLVNQQITNSYTWGQKRIPIDKDEKDWADDKWEITYQVKKPVDQREPFWETKAGRQVRNADAFTTATATVWLLTVQH